MFKNIKFLYYVKWYHKLFLWILPKVIVTEYINGMKYIAVYRKWFNVTYLLESYKE